jgi:ubiquinol-cytochrome c reductase cytochrome c subunit
VYARMIRALLVVTAFLLCAPGAQGDSLERGKTLYDQGCVSCHGPNARGVAPGMRANGTNDVRELGPSLVGVGALAADFYLTTGYMPLRNPFDQPARHGVLYSADDIRALVAYIGSFGGPPVPEPHPARGSLREGLRLFTENCAGCHQVVGQGGVVQPAVAPDLRRSTPLQIAEAVRVGPYVMPKFTAAQLSDREVDSIIAYVQLTKNPVDRGGWSIGHVGPVPEGLVAWLLAGTALVLLAAFIGERRKTS